MSQPSTAVKNGEKDESATGDDQKDQWLAE